jgi:uncharacterized damage-inducible protein DinB
MTNMADDNVTLTTFYTFWKEYQDHMRDALAPLTAEQLALPAGPGLRSIGETALHIVGCRVYWLTGFLGEDGGPEMQVYAKWNEVALGSPYAAWDDVAQSLNGTTPSGADLAAGLDRTWRFLAACLSRWSPSEMRGTFPDEWNGTPVDVSRAWVVWHILEHDLHHGGEISLNLGIHGIPAEFAV